MGRAAEVRTNRPWRILGPGPTWSVLGGIRIVWRRFSPIFIVGFCLISGCNQVPLAQEEGVALPQPRVAGRPRSIVCDPPRLHRLYEITDARTATELPWYMSRNDSQLTTQAGYQSTTEDRSVNVTYDRQSTSGGRSRDFYYNTTYRQSETHTIR